MYRAGIAFVAVIIAAAATLSDGGVSRPDRVFFTSSEVAKPALAQVTGSVLKQESQAGLADELAVEETEREAERERQAVEAAAAERERQQAAEAQEAAANAVQSRSTPPPAPLSAAPGGCCTHTDAWWSGVASCEQGGRNDPYFGYFSFMDGSQGGKSWDEQVAAGNALLNSVGHEIGPWAAACVAAGYRASPGG